MYFSRINRLQEQMALVSSAPLGHAVIIIPLQVCVNLLN